MTSLSIPRWTNAAVARVAAEVQNQAEDHTQYPYLSRFNVPTTFKDGIPWVDATELHGMMKPILNGSTPHLENNDPRGIMAFSAELIVKKYLKELLT